MLGKIRSGLKKAKNAGGKVLKKGGEIGLETAKAGGGMAINQATAGLIDKFGPKFGMVLSRTEDVLTQGEAIVESVGEQADRIERIEKKVDGLLADVKEIGAKVDRLAAHIERTTESEEDGDGVHSGNAG